MDWLSYSQSQELRERLTNIQQTLYESVEDKDENFEQNFRELCLFLNPADSMHALDKILDKEKMPSELQMACFLADFYGVKWYLPV